MNKQHFLTVLVNAPANTSESFILMTWRAWYAPNEVTHSKPLPTIEGSKHFLTAYVKLFHDVKKISTDDIIKGKSAVVVDPSASHTVRLKKPC
jgi:hypothetical protein